MVLGQFGVQTASIIAAVGAIGLALGLALQGTLQNIAAGIMLLALRPLRVGEYVEVGVRCRQRSRISGCSRRGCAQVDGIYLLAPNSTLWNQPVSNFTRNKARRNDIVVGIDYSDDIGLAERTLVDLAAKDTRVLKDPAPASFVAALGDSAVSVTLRYWTAPADYLATKMDLTKQAKLAFDDNGLSIPFPQQVVTFQNGAPEPVAAPATGGSVHRT